MKHCRLGRQSPDLFGKIKVIKRVVARSFTAIYNLIYTIFSLVFCLINTQTIFILQNQLLAMPFLLAQKEDMLLLFASLPHIFAKCFPNIYWKRKRKRKIKERNKEEVGSTTHTGNVVGHPPCVTFFGTLSLWLVIQSLSRSLTFPQFSVGRIQKKHAAKKRQKDYSQFPI